MNEGTIEQHRAAVAVWGDTHAANVRRMRESREELRDAVLHAVEAGMSESEAGRLAQVSRLTVRSWLGKDK